MPRASLALGLLALAACSQQTRLPQDMVGGYVHEEGSLLGLVAGEERLVVSDAGMALTGGVTLGVELGVAPSGARGKVGPKPTSDVFARVKCESATCTFQTKGGCEGSVTRSGGALLVVAGGECSAWSGRWVPERPPRPG